MGTIWNNSDGLDVHFGSRRAGERANFGLCDSDSSDVELVAYVSAKDFTAGTATYNGVNFDIPSGFTVRSVVAEVTEVFTLTGTTPAIVVGINGSVATNFAASLSQAQAQAVGIYNLSGGGSLAANTPLAADSTLTVGMSGTTPTVSGVLGKVKIVIKAVDPRA
jgi:hypothetical protein